MASKPTLTDDLRATLRGKMNVEVAALAHAGEITPEQAASFLLERATNKAVRKGLIKETA